MKGRTRFTLYDYEIDQEIEMLTAILESAYSIEGSRETILQDIDLASLQFVIRKGIDMIEELRK